MQMVIKSKVLDLEIIGEPDMKELLKKMKF